MTQEESKALSTLYQEEFQPDYYVARYYSGLEAGTEFCLRNHHRFFSSVGLNTNTDGTEKRVLEVGSGPVPIHVLSASRWSKSIICSDFLEQNRQKLTAWLSAAGHEADERWLPYAQYVAQLENNENPVVDGSLLLNRVRRSVCSVIPVDVLRNDPLLSIVNVKSTFDVIISVFCLECAVPSPKEYQSAVANVVQLLRPSGHIIMIGGLEGDHYCIRDRKIPRIKITREMIDSALENADCQVEYWEELPRSLRPPELPIDYKAMYYCVAKKNN